MVFVRWAAFGATGDHFQCWEPSFVGQLRSSGESFSFVALFHPTLFGAAGNHSVLWPLVVCVFTHTHEHRPTNMFATVHVAVLQSTCMYMYICVYMYVYVCICVHMYAYVCICVISSVS